MAAQGRAGAVHDLKKGEGGGWGRGLAQSPGAPGRARASGRPRWRLPTLKRPSGIGRRARARQPLAAIAAARRPRPSSARPPPHTRTPPPPSSTTHEFKAQGDDQEEGEHDGEDEGGGLEHGRLAGRGHGVEEKEGLRVRVWVGRRPAGPPCGWAVRARGQAAPHSATAPFPPPRPPPTPCVSWPSSPCSASRRR